MRLASETAPKSCSNLSNAPSSSTSAVLLAASWASRQPGSEGLYSTPVLLRAKQSLVPSNCGGAGVVVGAGRDIVGEEATGGLARHALRIALAVVNRQPRFGVVGGRPGRSPVARIAIGAADLVAGFHVGEHAVAVLDLRRGAHREVFAEREADRAFAVELAEVAESSR